MQVADAVADANIGTWADLLADEAIAIEHESQADTVMASLLLLPPHLLHLVLSTCVCTTPLPQLLATFPHALHPGTIAAAVSTSAGSLALPNTADFSLLLMFLRFAVVPPPGLLSVTLDDSADTPEFTPPVSALLGRALAAHPSLTDLDLHASKFTPECLTIFSGCLSSVALMHLTLLNIAVRAQPSGCAAIAACLRSLPQLRACSIDVIADTPAAEEQPSLATLIRPLARPATLSHLERLHVKERRSGPGRLRDGSLPQLLPLFQAPVLTHLTYTSSAGHIYNQGLIDSLAHLPALRSFTMDTDAHDSSRQQQQPPPAACLAALQELTLRSACPAAPLATAAAIARHATESLTSLMLLPRRGDGGDAGSCARGCSAPDQPAWAGLLEAAGRCTRMARMHVDVLHGYHQCALARAFTASLCDTLAKLSGLTSLSLQAEHRPGEHERYDALHAEGLAGALLGLRGLRVLRLRSAGAFLVLRDPHAQHVIDACAALPVLEALELCCHGVHLEQVSGMLANMPAIKSVGLLACLFNHTNGEDRDTYAARYPGISITVSG